MDHLKIGDSVDIEYWGTGTVIAYNVLDKATYAVRLDNPAKLNTLDNGRFTKEGILVTDAVTQAPPPPPKRFTVTFEYNGEPREVHIGDFFLWDDKKLEVDKWIVGTSSHKHQPVSIVEVEECES